MQVRGAKFAMVKTAPEPWLRGTHAELSAIPRGALHAIELAEEDLERWCGSMSNAELDARPSGLPSVAFQLRHIAGSLDRLLTYAEGSQLDARQLRELEAEPDGGAEREKLFEELAKAFAVSRERILKICSNGNSLEEARTVGRRSLPTTVGGLLIHVADHTQRHVGQAITTAKVVVAHQRIP